jgi:putative ABC transport system permease protein
MMISNFFKIAVRNLLRYKGYSSINIVGLAIGMACCAMILLFVRDELQYDRYHENADRIYRINEIVGEEGRGERSASNPFPVGPTLVFDYPQYVEASVRFFNFQAPALAVSTGDRKFNETRLFFVDSTVFQVFSYRLL